jgi:hypothetical protein
MSKHLSQILTKHFPIEAYASLKDVINTFNFSFKVTRDRVSKLGDFRVVFGQKPTITVNGTLNPYSFLITFLHEFAHLAVYQEFGVKVKPHGYEWKSVFQEYLLITIKENLFPDDLLEEILLFTNNPKASTSACPTLMKALARYDERVSSEGVLYLDDIGLGELFVFRKELYRKIEKRRTRVMCERVLDKRRYTISGHAEVNVPEY